MYFDDDLAFQSVRERQASQGLERRLVGALLNLFSAVYKTYGKTSDAIKENADLVGEGKIMGGLFVISKNGVEYAHREALRHRRACRRGPCGRKRGEGAAGE